MAVANGGEVIELDDLDLEDYGDVEGLPLQHEVMKLWEILEKACTVSGIEKSASPLNC